MMNTRPRYRRGLLRGLLVGGVLAVLLAAAQAGREINLNMVPAKVRAAADRVVKKASWTKAEKSQSEGQDHYDLHGTDSDKRDVSVEVSAEGKVTGVEREIEVKDVPRAVLQAVNEKFPKLKPTNALEIFHGDDIQDLSRAETTYQLNGPAAKKKDLTVEVSSEGKIIEVKREVDLKEVPKVVAQALTKKLPGFTTEIVHHVVHEGNDVGYVFSGHRGKQKMMSTVFVSADGKEIEVEHD